MRDADRATRSRPSLQPIVTASTVGVFLHAIRCTTAALAARGERAVRAGQALGLLQDRRRCWFRVVAPADGIVGSTPARRRDGAVVGYGTASSFATDAERRDDAMDIDLNADLGEGFGPWRMGDDEALLDVVSSANVACGFHAGDPADHGPHGPAGAGARRRCRRACRLSRTARASAAASCRSTPPNSPHGDLPARRARRHRALRRRTA